MGTRDVHDHQVLLHFFMAKEEDEGRGGQVADPGGLMDVDRIGCRSWTAAGGAASQARSNGCRAEPIPGQVRQHELSLQKLGRAAWAAFQRLIPHFWTPSPVVVLRH